MYAFCGNKHFLTKQCCCQTYKNYEQPLRTSQNCSALEIVQIFQKKILKSTGLGEQLLVRNVFENFDL